MNNFFSIIIPTFNRGKLLIRALNSVYNQSFKDFEVIVIDDGSTDDTEFICKKYIELHTSFHYIKIGNSGGPARPRNFGIESSTGKWLCFLDSDDYWYSNKLEFCYSNISNDTDIIYHDLTINNLKKTVHGKNLGLNPVNYLLTNGNGIPLSSSIIRKSCIKNIRFNEDSYFSSIEDYEFWIRVACQTRSFKHLKKKLGYYHIDNKIRITQFNESSAKKYLHLKNYLINNNIINKHNAFFLNYSIGINLCNSEYKRRASIYLRFVFFKHPTFLYKLKSLVYLIKIFIK